MSKGWVVVCFNRNKGSKTVSWFEEKFEAQEEAERLNQEADKDTWYGWERDK
jgi:hypothetical protein